MSLAESLYARAPVWLQEVMVSARGAEFRLRRASTPALRRHLGFLLGSQYWLEARMRAHQTERLQALLRVAFERVPHYREVARRLGVTAADFRSPEDLRRLPLLEKHELRGQEQRFLDDAADRSELTHMFTSGTTGTPLNIYETQASYSERHAFVARLRVWAGLSDPIYPRRCQFTGRAIVPGGSGPYWRHNLPGNALLLSTTHLSPATVPAYAQAMRAYAPELIDGYPSAMLIVARVAKRLGLELPRPRALIATAETLLPEHRVELEAAYGAKVYNQYAATEPSCFWGDCAFVGPDGRRTMHESPEYGISEILRPDGTPAEPGEVGEVVLTSFLDPVMPFIRYRVGDLAVRGPHATCGCGRPLPRIESVEGRRDDILYVPERGYVGRLDPCFKGLSDIVEAQIVQDALDHVTVLLVPAPGYHEGIRQNLEQNLRAKLGASVGITVTKVEAIPRGANGKFRSVISRVRDRYPDRM